MARVKFDEMEKYAVKSASNWFGLKDDHDVARVRFLFDSLDDLPIRVHDIQLGEGYRSVVCLRDYDDPVHKCPLCEAGNNPKVKLFIPLYDEGDEKVKFWQRPQSFGSKISSQFARYKDFSSHIFEIERLGKPGDRKTSYELYEVDKDNGSLEDFEVPDAIGTAVMNKTADELRYYVENGEFEESSNNESGSRRSAQADSANDRNRVTRRTPSNIDRF